MNKLVVHIHIDIRQTILRCVLQSVMQLNTVWDNCCYCYEYIHRQTTYPNSMQLTLRRPTVSI